MFDDVTNWYNEVDVMRLLVMQGGRVFNDGVVWLQVGNLVQIR